MLKVFETFSGIGSQAKALKNRNIDHEIVATADWDISAIIAYDLIHNGDPVGDVYQTVEQMTIEEIDEELNRYTFSLTGKVSANKKKIRQFSQEAKRRLLGAVIRSKNLVSMTKIQGVELPDDIDLLTYSFPCQDLSLCKFWHGDVHGIDRDANTRSGMLWEVERLLREMQDEQKILPRFLLMENVCAILNALNKSNFDEWKSILDEFGYTNIIFRLNAKNFGIPQMRERAYMISIRTDHDSVLDEMVTNHFQAEFPLDNPLFSLGMSRRVVHLSDILRLDYSEPDLRKEADESQPNGTVSRAKIYEENVHLLDTEGKVRDIVVNTLTTKQDRNPNSGVVAFTGRAGGAAYRNLTPRECFMLMGFDESDYEVLIRNNVRLNKRSVLFTRDKLNKLAGNSIVVDVLECIFVAIHELKKKILVYEEIKNG